MSQKSLSAGDTVDSRCTRCRAVTNHTIVAMVEDRVARVRCNTCGGDHNYHRPAGPKPAGAKAGGAAKTPRTPRKTRASAAAELQQEWESLQRGVDPSQALPYDMEGGYRVNDALSHPVFGIGVVTALFKPNKMEVFFQGGKKLLRCRL